MVDDAELAALDAEALDISAGADELAGELADSPDPEIKALGARSALLGKRMVSIADRINALRTLTA